jgi:hypothetical protein
MALFIIVEDGSIVPGANTYVDPAGEVASNYFDAHLFPAAWTSATLDNRTKACIMATRYIDDLVAWKGYKVEDTQPREWPRKDVRLGTYVLPNDAVPLHIQHAVCETALSFLGGDRISDTGKAAGVSSINLGNSALELQFNQPDPTRNLPIIPRQVADILEKYGVVENRGLRMVPVSR